MAKVILQILNMRIRINLILLLAFAVSGCHKNPHKLTIATAANVQFAMEELSQQFTSQSGIQCDVILGSSGKLTAQIKAGAPYDIFVSADMKYPNELYKTGLTTHKPEVYAFGRLVLWTSGNTVPSIDSLNTPGIKHIAIANPETAPYGRAAVEALRHYGLYDPVKNKLVFGESIAQVNQFILSKTAGVGFTSRSVVMSPQMKDKGKWTEVAENAYTPITQGAVMIKREGMNEVDALIFYRYLFSDQAREILKKYGYLVNP